eukprot:IDg18554t1
MGIRLISSGQSGRNCVGKRFQSECGDEAYRNCISLNARICIEQNGFDILWAYYCHSSGLDYKSSGQYQVGSES